MMTNPRVGEPEEALDHDMNPEIKMVPSGIFEPTMDHLSIVFSTTVATSDFVADCPELCHSKYNPVERCWGVLEMHWNGTLLSSVNKAIRGGETVTWNGVHPAIHRIDKVYREGVKLTKEAMKICEERLERLGVYQSGVSPSSRYLGKLFIGACLT